MSLLELNGQNPDLDLDQDLVSGLLSTFSPFIKLLFQSLVHQLHPILEYNIRPALSKKKFIHK